jgi:hypothetical protein
MIWGLNLPSRGRNTLEVITTGIDAFSLRLLAVTTRAHRVTLYPSQATPVTRAGDLSSLCAGLGWRRRRFFARERIWRRDVECGEH